MPLACAEWTISLIMCHIFDSATTERKSPVETLFWREMTFIFSYILCKAIRFVGGVKGRFGCDFVDTWQNYLTLRVIFSPAHFRAPPE
jgi:hypothetical protein